MTTAEVLLKVFALVIVLGGGAWALLQMASAGEAAVATVLFDGDPRSEVQRYHVFRALAIVFLVGASAVILSFWLPPVLGVFNLCSAAACVAVMFFPLPNNSRTTVSPLVLGLVAGLNVIVGVTTFVTA